MRNHKFVTLLIFVLGIVIVFALIATRNFFTMRTAYGSTAVNLSVFDDQLSGSFMNWSWNSAVDFNQGSPVFSGTKSIKWMPNPWGGLYLHTDSGIDPNQYASLQLAVQSSDADSNLTVLFYDGSNQKVNGGKPLSTYPKQSQNGWHIYTITLNGLPSQIKGFALQETSGSNGAVINIDQIQFLPAQTLTGTNTGIYSIYTDTLTTGWVNWSWNSTINFSNSSPVSQGSASISYTPTTGYGGLYLHTDNGVQTAQFTTITFTAKAAAEGEAFNIGVYDANNQLLHQPVSLESYGGQPTTTAWKTYAIPLADLGAGNALVKGFSIYDATGQPKGTLYIDQISLSANGFLSQTTAGQSATVQNTPTPTIPQPLPTTQTAILPSQSGNPLAGTQFFNDQDSNPAAAQQAQWAATRPSDALMMDKIASQPKAMWMGNWINDIQSTVHSIIQKALADHKLPIFVAYNIPGRDCGNYSAGGSSTQQAYQSWIDGFAAGIGFNKAAIILEPDALAQITCLSTEDQQNRLTLLSYAVKKFKSLGQTVVYLDAGNSGWINASEMAKRLTQADVSFADGFSINVSNFATTLDSVKYGKQISALINNKHFVIDTSRNGNGPTPDNQWCNPPGRALGVKPSSQTDDTQIDAYLWIKYPGESDGTCNGGPQAGAWYPDYALGLAQNAHW